MKKTLYYAVAAILLGIVTMLGPAMLFGSIYFDPSGRYFGEIDSESCMDAARSSQSLWTDDGAKLDKGAAGLMLVPSFLLALGVSLYLKKRIS